MSFLMSKSDIAEFFNKMKISGFSFQFQGNLLEITDADDECRLHKALLSGGDEENGIAAYLRFSRQDQNGVWENSQIRSCDYFNDELLLIHGVAWIIGERIVAALNKPEIRSFGVVDLGAVGIGGISLLRFETQFYLYDQVLRFEEDINEAPWQRSSIRAKISRHKNDEWCWIFEKYLKRLSPRLEEEIAASDPSDEFLWSPIAFPNNRSFRNASDAIKDSIRDLLEMRLAS